jgi:hypothetical protein
MARSTSPQRRHKGKGNHATSRLSVGTCRKEGCGKQSFTSKQAAKNTAKSLYPGKHKAAYECNGYWHYGSPPQAAMAGLKGRREVYAGG